MTDARPYSWAELALHVAGALLFFAVFLLLLLVWP